MPAARAWEPATTHAGLAEQAALASELHKRLESIGFAGGLYELLTIPPADAPGLLDALKQLPPSQGGVPDARGRQPAMGWLVAGAQLADTPMQAAANHFYDVQTHGGWQLPDRGVFDHLEDRVREALGRAQLPARGVPAPDWVVAKDNPFSLAQFLDKYAKAVTATTPGERSARWRRHSSRRARCCTRSAISARPRACAATTRRSSSRSAAVPTISARASSASRRSRTAGSACRRRRA